MAEVCPLCGGQVSRVEISSTGGKIEYSSCCGVPQVVLDNWATYESLPETLREAAIRTEREKHAELTAAWEQEAKWFAEALREWERKHRRHWEEFYGKDP